MAIGGTVCGVVFVSYIIIVILAFVRPQVDTSQAASQISDVVNTLVGLLAGFLAGRTTNAMVGKNGADGG